MKVIFLDFDGVLNSFRTVAAFGSYGFPPREEKHFMRSELKLDPVAIGLVRDLCEKSGAKIVISSAWRIGTPIEHFIRLFGVYGWPDAPVIGKTDQTAEGFRGTEVADWLQIHGQTVTHHVIFDDHSDFHSGQPLVKTTRFDGLTHKCYVEALELLGEDAAMWEAA